MGPYGQDSVERFRVRTTGPIGLSKPVLRLRMERQIGVDALHPRQLPSSAILIVRELAVKSGFPGAAIPLAGWSASLRRQLAALITLAVRPIDGAPPTTARCVLFADEGEFLACLTRDTIGHVVQQRWYWSHLVGHEAVNQVHLLAKIWRDRPIAIPAALQLLTFHERRAVVCLFDEVQRTAITHALYHTFKLPGAWPSSGPALRPRENQQTTARQPKRRADSAVHPLAPWHPWLAGRDVAGLPPSAEQLLGVGLGLAAAPAVVRSKAFVARAQAWIAEAQTHRFEPATQTQHTVRVGDPGHMGPSQRGPGAKAGNSPPTSGNTPAHGVLPDGRLPKHAEARLRLPPETSQQQSVSLRSQLPPFTSADQAKHPVPFGEGIEERSSDRQHAANRVWSLAPTVCRRSWQACSIWYTL